MGSALPAVEAWFSRKDARSVMAAAGAAATKRTYKTLLSYSSIPKGLVSLRKFGLVAQ